MIRWLHERHPLTPALLVYGCVLAIVILASPFLALLNVQYQPGAHR